MKETKPYWYADMAYSMEPYFVCLHFPNLLKAHTHLADVQTANAKHWMIPADRLDQQANIKNV